MKEKKRWPTKAVMEQIYDLHLWGGEQADFYSGSGSHDKHIVQPYVEEISAFLKQFKKSAKVLDLGCGDFNVGEQLLPFVDTYIGIDIVESLIKRNREKYKDDASVSFEVLDICNAKWPEAEIVFIRQVLQHLSNAEISKVVQQLPSYSFVVLTEHIPLGDFVANADIVTGQGIRLKKKSGVDITLEPFNYKPTEVLGQFTLPYDEKSCIKTTIYKN